MVVLRAIGGFFARIGRWIKETAWIQPLLIVGAIFAVIFAIPHIINGVKGWFNESDSSNKFFAEYQLSLKNANVIKEGEFTGSSRVDKLFTALEKGETEKVQKEYGQRFFLAFIEKDGSSSQDLYEGLKAFKDRFNKNSEFKDLAGQFKLYTIYTDTKVTVDKKEINLFDKVWLNHYSLFETMSTGGYLDQTFYALNNNFTSSNYESNFTAEGSETCPMNKPLTMYFDFSGDNKIPAANQQVKGLSDVIFNVEGSTPLERARTLRDCWSHTNDFGKLNNN